MKKKFLIAALSVAVISSLAPQSISAATINNPETIKVGLKSIEGISLTLKLQGDYKINGAKVSDKSLTFKTSGSKVSYNGSTYNEIKLEPASSSSSISATVDGKTNVYSGDIILKVQGGKVLPINNVKMQNYLKGVLPYEISNSYPIEAIKTQAITSRTFALSNLHKHKSEGYELCDTTNCQVYRGENSSYKNIEKAVDETENQILTYNGALASVTFGASNGGTTESSLNIWGSDVPYLPAIEDKYDVNPWPASVVHTKSKVQSLLRSSGLLGSSDTFVNFGKITKNNSGRVATMEVIYKNSKGVQTTKTLKKEEPRWAFSLRSMKFDVNYDSKTSSYTFNGTGYGHGVGMSQYGAKARAEAGQDSKEILSFYFPGTELKEFDNNGKEVSTIISEKTKTGKRTSFFKSILEKI